MLILYETSAGYALLKAKDKVLSKFEDASVQLESEEKARSLFSVQTFSQFKDGLEAVKSYVSIGKGKIPSTLKSLLKKQILKTGCEENLVVGDVKLAGLIKDKMNISCLYDNKVQELYRSIRTNFEHLFTDIKSDDIRKMTLGLAHSLSRFKLKLSSQKLDVMVIQAVTLLDDVDKEINNYVMRCREWYGWHFPELSTIVTDGVTYTQVIKTLRMKEKASIIDFSEIIPKELASSVCSAAEVSIGSEITEIDMENIIFLCDQVLELSEYRKELQDYLSARMQIVAPNLSNLLGELVGARLIAHAGSLMNLAKSPSSTIQVFGAEKSLFRALKMGKSTPKYGLIYHCPMISSAASQFKGKVSRSLAAKAALAVRVDALSEDKISVDVSLKAKSSLESRIHFMESGKALKQAGKAVFRPSLTKIFNKEEPANYSSEADFTKPVKREHEEAFADEVSFSQFVENQETATIPKKKKKKSKSIKEEEGTA